MKKIIPAVCMSLLGLAAVGTGSYAWFTANSTVTATGMTITASTGASLHIVEGYQTSEATIVDTNVTFTGGKSANTGVNPVSLEFGKEGAETVDSLKIKTPATWTTEPTLSTAGVPATYTTVDTIDIQNGWTATGDYLASGVASIYRKSDTAGSFNFRIKASVPGVSKAVDLDKALMAGVLIDSGASGAVEFYPVNFSSGLSESVATEVVVGTLSGLENNKIYHIRFLEWYDGNNTYCTTAAAEGTLARPMSFNMEASESAFGA